MNEDLHSFCPDRRYVRANLEKQLVEQGLTLCELAKNTGLDLRTVKSMLRKDGPRPHARSVYRLARGLGIPPTALLSPPRFKQNQFDRQTNPVIDEVIADHPRLFSGWSEREFDELYSRFGTGGALTYQGTIDAAEATNRRRQLISKVALLMETTEADLLTSIVETLYKRAIVAPEEHVPSTPTHGSCR